MKYIFTTILILSSILLNAQGFKDNHDIGFGLSYAKKEFNVGLNWTKYHLVGSSQKFKLGYGLRFNGYINNDKYYITAPAELTSGEKGPQVFFIENIEENIDTFKTHSAQFNSLNAAIFLRYDFTPKWGVGFNIDAVGFGFGREVEGKIISSNRPASTSEKMNAKPTSLNALLISDNDIGMLNSELFVQYHLNPKWSVTGGLTFLFTEYTTNDKVSYNFNNDRFRYKSLMGMLSIHYVPF